MILQHAHIFATWYAPYYHVQWPLMKLYDMITAYSHCKFVDCLLSPGGLHHAPGAV